MNKNTIIVGTGIYHPKKKVNNQYYIEHFKNFGIDIASFLENFGRKERYIIDNEQENALTMAIEAAKNALNDAKITPDKIDAIVFSSDTPEYLCPSNALLIRDAIGANNAHTVYDLNANCIGMLVAMDQVSRYMKTSKKIKYALIVGSLYVSSAAQEDSKYTFAISGDGAAAVILECKEENHLRGLIDSKYSTDTTYCNKVLSPSCGMTKARLDTVTEYDRKQIWNTFPISVDSFVAEWGNAVYEFMNNYDFPLSDIQYYFMSQYSKQYIIATAKYLNIEDIDKHFVYIGDKFAYTGTTSPIFALHEALHNREIKPGKKAMFCSLASGISLCSLLYEF
ncbi:MAG: ketoacyl-ACP synthase III [Clostridium butyricum]|nr:ketoacyl-ACP synthase III [Clostridium butyricum]